MNQTIHKVEVKLSIKEISKEIWNELANEINNPFYEWTWIKNLEISKSQPISIVASNSKNFNTNWKYFRQPIRRWLISSGKVDNSSNNKFEKELFFEDSWEKTLIALKKQGINDLALLGGAKLINSFIKEDLITDIKITIIPRIIGGRYTWIPPEQTNAIFNLKRLWEIKTIKNLMNNEIHIHYKKI